MNERLSSAIENLDKAGKEFIAALNEFNQAKCLEAHPLKEDKVHQE